jgi:RNA polymerase sigma-54 factor
MGFEMRQQQRMSQELRMTPQLQQAIKLLQLNHLELAEALQTELLENPLLEEVSGDDERATPLDAETAERREREREPDPAFERSERQAEERSLDEAIREIDWESFVENYSSPLPSTGVAPDGDLPGYDQTVSRSGGLTEHLLQQLSEVDTDELERRVAEVIIYNLDEEGYLRNQSLDELAASLEIDLEVIEDALALVQDLDPTGVGARNLAECLILQAVAAFPENRVVIAMLRHHMVELERRDHAAIARALKVSRDEVVSAHRLVQTLDPRPGLKFSDAEVRYIAPDIYIEKRNDEWVAILNDDGMPRLRVSREYRRVLRGSQNADEKQYVRERLNSARFMLRSIEQRQRTILRVTESIIRFQREFFDRGIQFLRPLVLREIADDIEMHESTVSRVTTNKYVHTPRGLFELKFFFNSSIRRSDGDDIAAEAVKHHIRALIEREDEDAPLSDQKIVELLLEHNGIEIARRTVAKYRESLGILSSSKRRRLA